MKFDVVRERQWAAHNKQIQDSLRVNPLSTVRTYPGLTWGISEITRGLARLFPHRKSFAVVKGSGPFFDEIVDFLSTEGLLRTDLTVKDLATPDEAIKKIPKDCLFVLGSYDDPITGEVFAFESLNDHFHKNRCFTIALSHSLHLARGVPAVSQYMAWFAKYGDQGAIGLLGQRASRVPMMAPGPQDWFHLDSWQKGFDKSVESPELIQNFERKLPKGFVPYFDQSATRIYDRAVFRALEFDGSAVIELLAEELGAPLAAPGTDPKFETLSLCRWESVNAFNWYVDQGRSLKDLRGVVILDSSLVNDKTTQALTRVAQKLTQLQS